MLKEHASKHRGKLLLAAIVVLAAGSGLFASNYFSEKKNEQVFCTLEAKLCPDGTMVGRTGPNCEFAECPSTSIPQGWKTMTDEQSGLTFSYPETLETTYISTTDWPPSIFVVNEPFSCVEAGSPIDRAGETRQREINGHIYCVTTIMEGAAGSTYTQYAYVTEIDGKVISLTFSLRMVQCMNYDDPQQTECLNERETFNVDPIIHQIAQSVR